MLVVYFDSYFLVCAQTHTHFNNAIRSLAQLLEQLIVLKLLFPLHFDVYLEKFTLPLRCLNFLPLLHLFNLELLHVVGGELLLHHRCQRILVFLGKFILTL